ncbi:MAG: HAD family hydrolase [Lachnospiraceae bacterium]|nr:HAD family hydrolase [Lachnospiraceae bacterium]
MIRLFSSDMDGTLLDNWSRISERTKRAILRFQELGGCFVVNTGREYTSAKKELDDAGISCDVICAGGAAIYDRYGDILEQHMIPKPLAQKIIDIFDQYDMYVDLYTNIGKVAIVPPFDVAKYYHEQVLPASKKEGKVYFRTGNDLKILFDQVVHFDGAGRLFDSDVEIYKICSCSLNTERLGRVRKACKQLSDVEMTHTSDHDIELTHKNAKKGLALLSYASRKGISKQEILAVGDSENDRSMLELPLGRTIAVGNATPEIKLTAKEVCGTNMDEGVADLLEELMKEYESKNFQSLKKQAV